MRHIKRLLVIALLLPALLWCAPVYAACALVSGQTHTTIQAPAGTTITATLPNPSTTGNLLDVQFSLYNGRGNAVTNISDGVNTFTNVFNLVVDNTPGVSAYSWYAKNITGQSTETVTVTLNGTGYWALTVTELSGASTTSPLGINETSPLASTTTPSYTSTGTASAGDCVIVSLPSSVGAVTLTPDASYTSLYNYYGGAEQDTSVAAKVASSSGTQSYSGSTNHSNPFLFTMMSYKAASAPVTAKSFLIGATP